jgi:hypothetical protein
LNSIVRVHLKTIDFSTLLEGAKNFKRILELEAQLLELQSKTQSQHATEDVKVQQEERLNLIQQYDILIRFSLYCSF